MKRPPYQRIYSLMASFQNMGERVLYSFATLYADAKGASYSEQGLMLSVQNILAFIGQQFFGRTSDNYGRPIVIMSGYLVSVVTAVLIFQFNIPLTIIAVYAFYNIGFSAVQPAWNALIGDTFSDKERSQMLGAIGSSAALVGGVFYISAGLISDHLANPFRFLFTAAAISFSIAFLVILSLSLTKKIPERKVPERNANLSLFDPVKNKNFRRFVISDVGFAFALSTTWPLFARTTNDLATTAQVSIIWFSTFLFFSITARQTFRIKRRIGNYNKALYISRCMMWIVPTGFAFATSWVHILLVRIISGLSFGFYSILQKEYILETSSILNRPQDRGWFLGTYSFFYGIATFFGSLISGLIAQVLITHSTWITYHQLFLATAFFRLTFAFLYWRVPQPGFDSL